MKKQDYHAFYNPSCLCIRELESKGSFIISVYNLVNKQLTSNAFHSTLAKTFHSSKIWIFFSPLSQNKGKKQRFPALALTVEFYFYMLGGSMSFLILLYMLICNVLWGKNWSHLCELKHLGRSWANPAMTLCWNSFFYAGVCGTNMQTTKMKKILRIVHKVYCQAKKCVDHLKNKAIINSAATNK